MFLASERASVRDTVAPMSWEASEAAQEECVALLRAAEGRAMAALSAHWDTLLALMDVLSAQRVMLYDEFAAFLAAHPVAQFDAPADMPSVRYDVTGRVAVAKDGKLPPQPEGWLGPIADPEVAAAMQGVPWEKAAEALDAYAERKLEERKDDWQPPPGRAPSTDLRLSA